MKHQGVWSQLTLEQRVALLSGRDIWSTHPFPQAKIPSIFLSDGPHGVRKQLGEGDHLGLNASQPATCFPTAAGVANSWDPGLAHRMGCAIGQEAAVQQVNVLLGPGLNIKRSPLGGRNFEYYSEDPYLAGKMAAGLIRGIQEQGISACPKHFAANSQELLRMCSNSVVDERTLRELYLTGFEIAVKEGHPKCIMTAYNQVNGVYANENAYLLTEILRGEWGFEGFVVTDWGGCNSQVEGIRAGSNLEMPGTIGDSDRELLQGLKEGRISEDVINQRVDELLDVILTLGEAMEHRPTTFDERGHHQLARQVAAQTAVLLKNEGEILPLTPDRSVAVLGDFAKHPRYQGAGSSLVHVTQLDIPLDLLNQSGLSVVGYGQGYWRNGKGDQELIQEGVALAQKADVVLLYLGLPEIYESEGMDRSHMALPENQVRLLKEVYAVNTHVVVVLAGGAPIEMPWLGYCQGLFHGYLGGQAGAGAMVDLLTGKINPSGKLAESYPITYQDTPNGAYFPGRERSAEYREGLFVGYRYYRTVQKPVCFPFGYGLSYTTFAYQNLQVHSDHVTLQVRNTGDRPGGEIVQLYVSMPESQMFRPVQELKGFQKVWLEPGEETTVTIPFDDYTFRYFHIGTHRWEQEGGLYELWVGASSEDIRLKGSITLKGTGAVPPYHQETRELLACYYSGEVQQVSDQAFQALLGEPIPPSRWDDSAPLGWNDSLTQMYYAKGFLARMAAKLLVHLQKKSMDRGEPDLNILFLSNMPFRGLAKMSNGMVTTEMAKGLQEMANGHVFQGAGQVIRGWFGNQKEKEKRKERLSHVEQVD